MKIKEPTGRLARWIMKLQELDFIVVHRPGREHVNADAMMRPPFVQSPTVEGQSKSVEEESTRGDDIPSVISFIQELVDQMEVEKRINAVTQERNTEQTKLSAISEAQRRDPTLMDYITVLKGRLDKIPVNRRKQISEEIEQMFVENEVLYRI